MVDRMAFQRHVEREGLPYRCRFAESLADANELLASEPFDLIVLDHNLSDGMGFELLPRVGETPVIFVTGSENPENAVRAMKSGANDYLLKDQDRNYLKLLPVAVERALRQRTDREQLRELQELFRKSFNEAPIGKAFISPSGQFLRVNHALCDIFATSEQELLERGCQLLFGMDASPDCMASLFPMLSSAAKSTRMDMRCRVPRGHEIWIQLDMALAADSRGQSMTYIAQIMDVTAQRRAEEVRASLEAQLRKAQKMEALGSLAGGVAHEFNNMLGAIIGYTELTKMELGGNAELCANLDQVLQASARAKEIVQQILTFSRRQDLKRDLLQPSAVVQEAAKLIHLNVPKNVVIHVETASDTPPIFGNSTQIQQALMNVCNNAAHAMGERGGVIVIKHKIMMVGEEAATRLSLSKGPYSIIAVTDNGHGMDAATLERVFEPFFTTKGPGKGSGLGMAVVHGIMKAHDGAVTVQSELNKGTTVQLYFPVRPAGGADMDVREAPLIPSGRGQHVLFVDDEPALVQIGCKLLQHLGYKVTPFSSGVPALAAFRENPRNFSLVLTDLTMPGMTGIDLADELLKVRSDIPIIMATGFVEDSVREQAGLLGFREILLKPLTAQVLAKSIHRVLTAPAGAK